MNSGPILTRVAYDGRRAVTFRAAVLAAATTQRPGRPRWTEVTVYRTQRVSEDGATSVYVVAKVGRSILAHRRTCLEVNTRGMPRFIASPEQGRRQACLTCMPRIDPPAEDVVVEIDRHSLRQATSQRELEQIIFPHRDTRELFGMTHDLTRQLRDNDPDFARYWAESVAPELQHEGY